MAYDKLLKWKPTWHGGNKSFYLLYSLTILLYYSLFNLLCNYLTLKYQNSEFVDGQR